MSINEEAVQAAHAAICEENLDDCLEWRGRCVKAVEAAAPHMQAQSALRDSDLILSILEAAGINKADQFDALVAVQKLAAN